MIRGDSARARAMATRCFWPPESWAGMFLALSAIPTMSSSSIARFSAAARGVFLVSIGASVTLSMTDLCGNRLKSWNTIPTFWRTFARWRSSAATRPSRPCM